MGVSLADGRVACSVAGDVAGRGGACQCRIHSGGAIDLDSFSPGGQAREGEGQRGDAGKHIRHSGGRGRRGCNRCRGEARKMFWRDEFHGETDLNVHHESAGIKMYLFLRRIDERAFGNAHTLPGIKL